jgi:hypothetical protein
MRLEHGSELDGSTPRITARIKLAGSRIEVGKSCVSSERSSLIAFIVGNFFLDTPHQVCSFLECDQDSLQMRFGIGKMVAQELMTRRIVPMFGNASDGFSPIVQRILNPAFCANQVVA